jgi:hypothetical protein
MSLKVRELAEKYLQGDPDAIVLLDVAIGVVIDLNYLLKAEARDEVHNYYSERANLDEEIDNLSPQISELGLRSTLAPLGAQQ